MLSKWFFTILLSTVYPSNKFIKCALPTGLVAALGITRPFKFANIIGKNFIS